MHLRDVVNVTYQYYHHVDIALDDSYKQLRESIANCELLLLRSLGFDTNVVTPHQVPPQSHQQHWHA